MAGRQAAAAIIASLSYIHTDSDAQPTEKSLIFIFKLGGVAEAATAAGLRGTSRFRIFEIILLVLRQTGLSKDGGVRDSSPGTRNTAPSTAISGSSAESASKSKVGDVVKPPGPWPTSGLILRERDQQHVLRQFFLGHLGHVAKPSWLRSLYSEKWFKIQDFANFAAAYFVAECHGMNPSQNPISTACDGVFFPVITQDSFMTIGEDRNKDQFER